ncbi:hypothetical protein MMC30_003798 [Trapelia coarctata]|nr:hypothetical protein [Trapelia coarctata]
MPSKSVFLSAAAAILLAVLDQLHMKELLFDIGGIGRALQPIEEFPYSCRRIQHQYLEGCEDMWLDEGTRILYLACSGALSRCHWNPGAGTFNFAGRHPEGAFVSMLHIDEPGADGLFGLHRMQTIGYDGATGDGTLDTVGFDVELIGNSKLRFWIVNNRPPIDDNGQLLDAHKVGANGTVELFESERGSDRLFHLKTFSDKALATPNKPAAVGNGAFLVTNDKSGKVGLRKEMDIVLGGGTVAYCSSRECHVAAAKGFAFPNGVVKGKDGLYYVPNILANKLNVMELQPSLMLKEVDIIRLGMPIDNLSVDRDGDIWAAAIPKPLQVKSTLQDPFKQQWQSTVWRIHKRASGRGYEVKKVLEDRDGKFVAGATTALHDARTGRVFTSGAVSPFITICEPR